MKLPNFEGLVLDDNTSYGTKILRIVFLTSYMYCFKPLWLLELCSKNYKFCCNWTLKENYEQSFRF